MLHWAGILDLETKAYHWQVKVDKGLRGHVAEVESTRDDVKRKRRRPVEAPASKVLELLSLYVPRVAAYSLPGQTERNPHTRGKINRLSVAFRGSEANQFCRLNCCFIKTVA